ncbi:uncharacterized protein LOC111385241 [Olea europaea var. sylvestris]|uniref:uncharacterized protein LOC111385241 n=1 Tax=Olea europaea var. sylvestris TaxID=158386 RepID=UPI000C1D6BA8|nr:uncharacterized protein LOC111385241 [Olea europaea var. sylvestris]
MAVPISANPRAQDIPTPLVYPDHPCKFKEHLAVATAREFGLMPNCDIRSPGNEDRVAIAREGELVIFKDSLKGGFRWPLHPFFLALLTEHNMSPGQLVPNGWRMLTYFFIACRYLGIIPYVDLCRMVFDLKQLPQYSCFAYLSTRGGFRIPRMPSSLKGWKDKWFYAIPQDPDVPFSPRWGVPDTARFCGGQAYFESLERHRQMLEELEPLVYDLDDILGDDILELANMKGIEEMTFDPSALRQAVNKKSKAPQARAPGQRRGQKRPRDSRQERQTSGPGESSRPRGPSPGIVRTGSQQQDHQGTPRESVPRGPVDVVDLEDGSLPPGPANPEGCSRCHSVLSIVDKYRADVDLSNGLRALEAMALKTLGIARGLSLKEKDESSRMADLEGAVSARDLRIADLEEERAQLLREREHMRNDLRSAQGEAGTAKAEAEHFKLELDQLKKDFDEKLASAREEAIEDFKKSDAFNELKGDYAMGSYFHALKEARAFMRLRPDARPEDLKPIPEVADDLHLSESEENAGDEDVDIEGDDVEEGQGSQDTDA